MKNQLESIAKSYDKGVEYGRRGVDLYKNLPERITNDPDYIIYQKMIVEGSEYSGYSGHKEIRDYLSPIRI